MDDLSRAMPAIAGLIGASVAASYSPSPLSRRHWYSVLASGVAFAYFLSPMSANAIRHYWPLPWIPTDGGLEGVMGLMLGVMGIYIVSGFMVVGAKVSADPFSIVPFIRRLRK